VARVPEVEIERLKEQVSLVSLVAVHGVELRKAGADLVGRCPFHDDRTPSLVVTPAKNLWHCLGACQAGGSVVDWVMRAEGVSFRHAVELLRDGMPTSAVAGSSTGSAAASAPKRSTVRKLPAPVAQSAADGELLAQVVGFYARTLTESPEALEYLRRRRIAHPEVLTTFQLGYANRTLGLRLPDKRRTAGADLRGRLTTLGVFRASGHEHLTGSLVVPVFDTRGAVSELYGRKIRDDLRPGTPAHLYLPGPHRGVFNEGALAASEEIVLTESLIDALTLWCAGFRHVTASYGTEGFTPDHADALARHGIRRVLIGYDNDPAGNKAAQSLATSLLAEGIECFRVQLPQGQDINDVAMGARNPTDVLGKALRTATWMGKGPGPKTTRHHVLALPEPDETVAPPADADPVPSSVAAVAVQSVEEEPPAELLEEPPAGPTEPAGPVPPSVVSPAPPTTQEDAPLVSEREVLLSFGERRWRVRGLGKASSFDLLRVNLMVSVPDGRGGIRFHVDTLDLYAARARAAFLVAAAAELAVGEDVVKRDLGRVLLACEDLADQVVTAAQTPVDEPPRMTDAEKTAALALLRDPRLVARIVADFATAGVVGEATNCLVGYLAATSRKLSRPLAIIVQSTSAAGKSALMDAVLSFVPVEEQVRYSAMTGQSLFYVGESDLAHKVLAIAEEEGATRAAYALKLLQSDGEISIASTGKDTASGRLVTHTYRVTGPTAIILTTTSIEIDEELLNRCLVLTVDEDRAQTRKIHDRQRAAQTLSGLIAGVERDQITTLHRNAQRLLEPLSVVNPFADRLTFADTATRTRRDHVKYLTLIAAVTLLHQHQREIKTTTAGQGAGTGATQVRYIETTPADITLANTLAHEVLGRSLDELPPGTRRLLDALHTHVTGRGRSEGLDRDLIRFTRRQLREALGFGDTQLKVHLARLVDLELVIPHRLEAGGFAYELAWHPDTPGDTGGRVLPGLLDPTTLEDAAPTADRAAADAATTADRSGSQDLRSGPGRGPVGPRSGSGRGGLHEVKPLPHNGSRPVTDLDGPERTDPDPGGHDENGVVVAEPPAIPFAAAGGLR
jgi:DNA primase